MKWLDNRSDITQMVILFYGSCAVVAAAILFASYLVFIQ